VNDTSVRDKQRFIALATLEPVRGSHK